jgi:hypothetical protein
MSGYRQAVVALHELVAQDRGWILARLPEAERATLECYLDELKTLGFASGASLRQALPATANGEDAASSCLRRAPARRMAALLENEPPSLVAQLVAIEAWPWEIPVMKQFSPAFRDSVARARADVTQVAPLRRAFLTQAAARRVGQDDAADGLDASPRHTSVGSHMVRMVRMARRLCSTIGRLIGHSVGRSICQPSASWKR